MCCVAGLLYCLSYYYFFFIKVKDSNPLGGNRQLRMCDLS